MTAPVIRFSWRIPVDAVIMIRRDVRFIASEMARTIPIIMIILMLKLLYRFCIG